MARPRKKSREWQTVMKYQVYVPFDKMPDIHTLLFMSKDDAQNVIINALRRHIQDTGHPAADPRVQSAVAVRALRLDASCIVEIPNVAPVGSLSDAQPASAQGIATPAPAQQRVPETTPEPVIPIAPKPIPAPAPVTEASLAPPPLTPQPDRLVGESALADRWVND